MLHDSALGLLHAALPSSRSSSIVGSLSTVLNTIYFVSVGYVNTCAFIVILFLKNTGYALPVQADGGPREQKLNVDHLLQAIKLMFAGSVILTVSWGLIQLVSFFYDAKHSPQPTIPVRSRSLWHMVIECWKKRTILVKDTSEFVRLLSVLAMLLSAVGWVIFMGGLFNMNIMALIYLLYGWGAVIITPFMYLVSLFHAVYTGKASTVLGILASIFNTFFVVGMGFSVTLSSAMFFFVIPPELAADAELDFEEIKGNCRVTLGGGVVCLIFWTVVLVLWPFYRPQGARAAGDMKNELNGREYDYHPLLNVSSSVTESTESHENVQQAHVDQ